MYIPYYFKNENSEDVLEFIENNSSHLIVKEMGKYCNNKKQKDYLFDS
jgi:hypothetical protein